MSKKSPVHGFRVTDADLLSVFDGELMLNATSVIGWRRTSLRIGTSTRVRCGSYVSVKILADHVPLWATPEENKVGHDFAREAGRFGVNSSAGSFNENKYDRRRCSYAIPGLFSEY